MKYLGLMALLGLLWNASHAVEVVMKTSLGDVRIEIDETHAPRSAQNFLRYVDDRFYDGGSFHRTVTLANQSDTPVKIEVIQAAVAPGKNPDFYGPIPLETTKETGLHHLAGTISLARVGANTATSEFFICLSDQPALDFGGARNPDGQGFAAFGRVLAGMEVLKKIAESPAKGQKLTPPIRIIEMQRRAAVDPEVDGNALPMGDADTAWAVVDRALRGPIPAGVTKSMLRYNRWLEQRTQEIRALGLAFLRAYPTDPRRWIVVVRMLNMRPRFIVSYGPNAEKDFHDVRIDEVAAASWQRQLEQFERELAVAADVPAEAREQWESGQFTRQVSFASSSNREEEWQKAIDLLWQFAERHPANLDAAGHLGRLVDAYKTTHGLADELALWRRFAKSSNAPVAEMATERAQQRSAVDEVGGAPIDLAFSALDGRQVELRQLRGRIVLIDFWATWCGPCMEEMPVIRKLYSDFHAAGLEIIGVSCDFAPSSALPPMLAKKARTAEEVLEFTRKEDMPWPQYYSGHKHTTGGNVFAARFGVNGIPATFLLDRDGRLVAKNLHGSALVDRVRALVATGNK